MSDELKDANRYAEAYEYRINSGRHDAEMQEHSYKQAMLAAAIAQAAALERIADKLDALTSGAGNLKVERP